MNFKAELSDNIEANDKGGITMSATSSIEFGNNYGGEEFEYEGKVSQNKQWKDLEKPFTDYFYNTSEEEAHKKPDLLEFETPLIEYESSEIKVTTLNNQERKEIIEQLKALHNDAKLLMAKNKFLHKKYISLILNLPSTSKALDKFDETLIFEDLRYQETLENYRKIRDDISEKKLYFSEVFENMNKNFESAEIRYKNVFETLMDRESVVAKKIVPRKLSKQVWKEQVDRMIENQQRRMIEVAKMRLKYVQLQYKLENAQTKLKSFDNFGPGFSAMDYEILQKKKGVYTDKYEEQNESIRKYNDSNMAWAAMIKHFDEELDLYDKKVEDKIKNLITVSNDTQINYRKNVAMVKKRGIALKNITKLRIDIGLLDNIFLLKKMETDLRLITKLKKRVETIKSKILEGVKKSQDV